MSARGITIGIIRQWAERHGAAPETPEALLDAYHAEALLEAIEAARGEYLTDDTGTPEDAAYNRGVADAIDAIGAIAEHGKDTRPGTQPGTGESTQAAGFFQPGHTYRSQRHADLIFKCMALSADPDSGEQQAIGWRFGPPRQGIRRYRIAALDADDWNCCDWTEAGGPDA